MCETYVAIIGASVSEPLSSDLNVNFVCLSVRDMRIRYGPRECDARYANTLWAARKRCAICEYAMGRANAIRDSV